MTLRPLATPRGQAREMAEDEYDGQTLVGANSKTLGRLLRGARAPLGRGFLGSYMGPEFNITSIGLLLSLKGLGH